MTVVDSSVVVDVLIAEDPSVAEAERLLLGQPSPSAPDVLVFEVLAALRRNLRRGVVAPDRAAGAVDDLGDLPIELFPSLPLRRRVWELRDNLTAADALFVALAEQLGEPLATKDRGLAAAARRHAGIETIVLG